MLLQKNKNSKELFIQLYKNIKLVESIPYLNTNTNTNMKISGISFTEDVGSMFDGCNSLQSLDLSNFNTSGVKNMSSMFDWCVSLQSLDLSNFDTAKVEDMSCMFRVCENLTSLDLSGFDMSNIRYTDYMFDGCNNLKTIIMKNCNQYTIDKINEIKSKSVEIIL